MENQEKIRVVHIITGLNTGGAEMMLYGLLSHVDRTRFDVSVISLSGIGPIGEMIQSLDISVMALSSPREGFGPRHWFRLLGWLKEKKIHVIQTWLYHADLFGGLAARWVGTRGLVWGIHSSTLDSSSISGRTILITKICALLSRWVPARIVCVAEESRNLHARMGYVLEKMHVIPNGFDIKRFKPDRQERLVVRAELNIPANAPTIGLIGRYAPQKDHQCFIQAASVLGDSIPHVHFLMAGENVTWDNTALVRWISAAGIRERSRLLGLRTDIPRLMRALDILTSSSAYGEAFPMVVGEAMASEVPCVVTNVGDSALLIGDTGRVVPIKTPAALAQGWVEILEMTPTQQRQLGHAARKRIEENFSLPAIAKEYESLYTELVNNLRCFP